MVWGLNWCDMDLRLSGHSCRPLRRPFRLCGRPGEWLSVTRSGASIHARLCLTLGVERTHLLFTGTPVLRLVLSATIHDFLDHGVDSGEELCSQLFSDSPSDRDLTEIIAYVER